MAMQRAVLWWERRCGREEDPGVGFIISVSGPPRLRHTHQMLCVVQAHPLNSLLASTPGLLGNEGSISTSIL